MHTRQEYFKQNDGMGVVSLQMITACAKQRDLYLLMLVFQLQTTLWSAVLSLTVQLENYTKMHYVRMLTDKKKIISICWGKQAFLSFLCCAFLTNAVIFIDQVVSSEMYIPKNLKLDTLSTLSPLVNTRAYSKCCALSKLMISSLVFSVLRAKLFLKTPAY